MSERKYRTITAKDLQARLRRGNDEAFAMNYCRYEWVPIKVLSVEQSPGQDPRRFTVWYSCGPCKRGWIFLDEIRVLRAQKPTVSTQQPYECGSPQEWMEVLHGR